MYLVRETAWHSDRRGSLTDGIKSRGGQTRDLFFRKWSSRGRDVLVWCRGELQVTESVPSPPLLRCPALSPRFHLGLSTASHPAIMTCPHQEPSDCELPPHLSFLLRVLDASAFKIVQLSTDEVGLRLFNCREASLPSLLTPSP